MVKKTIYDLASPCYSLVLTSPQTALSVAHARKEMVRLTLSAGEVKVTGLKSSQFFSPFVIIPTGLLALVSLSTC